MPLMDAEQLRQYLEFYQDLGVKSVYRRTASAPAHAQSTAAMELPPLAPTGDTLVHDVLPYVEDTR